MALLKARDERIARARAGASAVKALDDFHAELELHVARIAPFRDRLCAARRPPASGRNDSSSK